MSKLDDESIFDTGRSILFRVPLAITRLVTAITSSSSEKRCRFLVSLTDVRSVSAPSLERFSRSSNPAREKTDSDAADVAGIERNTRASKDR